MTALSKTKYRFKRLLSETYPVRLCKNNQQVCIDYVKRRSKKNKFEYKNCGCTNFYVHDYQNSSFKIFFISLCITMTILSKIKPDSDAVDYFKELPFYNKPIKKPKVKRLKTLID